VLQLNGLDSDFSIKRLRNGRIKLTSKEHGTLILKDIEALHLGSDRQEPLQTIKLPWGGGSVRMHKEADGSFSLDDTSNSGQLLLLKPRPSNWRQRWADLMGKG
jgi:hypothetical protein